MVPAPLNTSQHRIESIRQYDINTDLMYQDIIRSHRSYLWVENELQETKTAEDDKDVPEQKDEEKHPKNNTSEKNDYGIIHAKNIKDTVHQFMSYGIWIQRMTHQLKKKV
jgi:hypothetical protein